MNKTLEHYTEQKKVAQLVEFIRDLAKHGTRFDTNPTMNYGGNVFDVGGRFTEYIHRIDEAIRDRASAALAQFTEDK